MFSENNTVTEWRKSVLLGAVWSSNTHIQSSFLSLNVCFTVQALNLFGFWWCFFFSLIPSYYLSRYNFKNWALITSPSQCRVVIMWKKICCFSETGIFIAAKHLCLHTSSDQIWREKQCLTVKLCVEHITVLWLLFKGCKIQIFSTRTAGFLLQWLHVYWLQ